jgi:hypothetical protein
MLLGSVMTGLSCPKLGESELERLFLLSDANYFASSAIAYRLLVTGKAL